MKQLLVTALCLLATWTCLASDLPIEARLEQAMLGDHRSQANAARNRYRHPVGTLTFLGLEDGMTVMDPIILTTGRLVEYEGGGDESRSNAWLAELQQEMFVEVHQRDANNAGIRDGDDVWVESPENAKVKVKAMITRRVGSGVAFMPFHFAGHMQGENLHDKYPEGADPYVLGEAANTAMTYGYDSVTQMQESKCSLCRITKA